MGLDHLDSQLGAVRLASETPILAPIVWSQIASTVEAEILRLDERSINRLRASMPIPPERYIEELGSFQAWMDLAATSADDPIVVRAQVMTELYVAFVWLRDSVFRPVAAALGSDSTFATIESFLATGSRRRLRNAVAHGRWCYTPDFDGLDCWDGTPPEHFRIDDVDLHAWQVLSRGTAIAVLLGLTAGEP